MKDPYAVYLAATVRGTMLDVEPKASLLIAFALGQRYRHDLEYGFKPDLLSRQGLMAEIRKLNASPQNAPKVRARDLFVEVVEGSPHTLQSPRPIVPGGRDGLD